MRWPGCGWPQQGAANVGDDTQWLAQASGACRGFLHHARRDRRADGPPWREVDFDGDPDWEWHSAATDTPEALYELWSGAVGRSKAAWAAAVANGGLDQPAKFTSGSGEPWNLRRVLVDLHEEYARHVGHADLLREAIDGLVGEAPPRP